MADTSRLVLCDVLCFLSNKFVNTTVKVLKSTLVDFYDVEDVVAAKQSLLVDIADIETSVKFPHTPHRRDSADRITREVDDILAIFTCLDENKLLDKLPKYVASGPDSMPSVRLYESGFKWNHGHVEQIACKNGRIRRGHSHVVRSGEGVTN